MSKSEVKNVMVVDDEEDVRAYISALLQDNGIEAQTAPDAITASEMLNQCRPDLIILDMVMPQKSGVNFYRSLKSDPDLCNIPVLIVTGLQSEFKKFISSRRNAPAPEGYVPKPFTQEGLLGEVGRILHLDLVKAAS